MKPARDAAGGAVDIEPLYNAVGGPLYAVHYNGYPYAAFSSANQAIAFWRGLDARGREYFHIEDANGQRVTLQEHRSGHASAILEALDRAAPSSTPGPSGPDAKDRGA